MLNILAESSLWDKTINYELIRGNPVWRFGLILIVLTATLAIGKIIQILIAGYGKRLEKRIGDNVATITLKSLSKPIFVVFFALGLYVSKICLFFNDSTGIRLAVGDAWIKIAQAVASIAVAYAIYRLVDVVEHFLIKWTSKTETKLDDMLVPVIRKSLRTTIAIVAAMFIIENVLGQDVKSILLGAGVGGIAIALAAKDTVANFFGSITIFADRPFQVDERIKIGEHDGPVESVGFRSTRIRTLSGHQVTIPNSVVANTAIENIGRRPFIRRTSNITITYDSSCEKTIKAVEIIKAILAETPEINNIHEKQPRVYFSDFNDWSLNIYMTYWVKPPDWWLYMEVNERVNFEIKKQFEAEGIEFAFPSQTLYLKKDENN